MDEHLIGNVAFKRTPVLLFLLLMSAFPTTVSSDNFTISYLATFRPVWGQRGMQGRVISGAVTYAVHKINADPTILAGHQLDFVYADTRSDVLVGLAKMSDHWREGCAAFFGPEDSCEVEGKLASAWNLPMFAYVSRNTKNKIMINSDMCLSIVYIYGKESAV